MVRPLKTLRPKPLNLSLDEDLDAKMRIYLFSEVEGRVPHGEISKFINGLLRKHFQMSPKKGEKFLRGLQTAKELDAFIESPSKVVAEAEPEGGQTDGTQSQEA